MGRKKIPGISMKSTFGTYIPALNVVLNKAGHFNGPEYRLGGMTGMAFKFIANKQMLQPSIFMYPLQRHTWGAMERMGIYSEVHSGYKNSPTFHLYRKKAIERVRESIDRETPALFWEPTEVGFAVIVGYDDEDKTFFYQDRLHSEEQMLLYDNVGKVGAASWLIQVIGERADKDIRDIYLDSMECCIDEWEITDNVALLVKGEFRSGRGAYENIIEGLERDNFSEIGASTILNYAIMMKEQVYLYFQEISNEFKMIGEAIEKYKIIRDIFNGIGDLIPRTINRANKLDRAKIPSLINCLKEAQALEEQAVQGLKIFLREDLHNRHVDYYDIKKYV